jgi:hypothetical protein
METSTPMSMMQRGQERTDQQLLTPVGEERDIIISPVLRAAHTHRATANRSDEWDRLIQKLVRLGHGT